MTEETTIPPPSLEDQIASDPRFTRFLPKPSTPEKAPDDGLVDFILTDPNLSSILDRLASPKKKESPSKPKPVRALMRTTAAMGAMGAAAAGLSMLPSADPQVQLPDINPTPLLEQAQTTAGKAITKLPKWDWTQGTKEVQAAPKEQVTILDEMIKPMIEEVQKRRAERAKNDPEYYHRVDKELNAKRVNILMFFTGTFLRRDLENVHNSANQIISYDTKTKTWDLISITGDVMSPDVEKYAKKHGQPPQRYSINNSYDVGRSLGKSEEEGQKLMRESFEAATGLSMDFEGVSSSGFVKDFIDNVFGGIEVDIPYDFFSYKVEIDDKEYPDHTFKQGTQKMDGARVVQYIAADDYERNWPGRLHHHRKHLVLDTLRKTLKENLSNPVNKAIFGTKFLSFMNSQLNSGRLKLDFDIGKSINFGALADVTKPLGLDQVKEGKPIIIEDSIWGGEGVQMLRTDAQNNQKSQGELAKYPDLWWNKIPPNSDPDAKDLVTDFWGVPGGPREIIKGKLTNK